MMMSMTAMMVLKSPVSTITINNPVLMFVIKRHTKWHSVENGSSERSDNVHGYNLPPPNAFRFEWISNVCKFICAHTFVRKEKLL